MATLLDKVTRLNRDRRKADAAFREALEKAKEVHSWSELADATGMSRTGVRYLARNLNAQRGARTS